MNQLARKLHPNRVAAAKNMKSFPDKLPACSRARRNIPAASGSFFPHVSAVPQILFEIRRIDCLTVKNPAGLRINSCGVLEKISGKALVNHPSVYNIVVCENSDAGQQQRQRRAKYRQPPARRPESLSQPDAQKTISYPLKPGLLRLIHGLIHK